MTAPKKPFLDVSYQLEESPDPESETCAPPLKPSGQQVVEVLPVRWNGYFLIGNAVSLDHQPPLGTRRAQHQQDRTARGARGPK